MKKIQLSYYISVITLVIFILTVLFIYITSSVKHIKHVYAEEITTQLQGYVGNNKKFPISFEYPKDWFIQERGSSKSTPFTLVLSEVNLNEYQSEPFHGYPNKFINIVYYKSDIEKAAYATNDLKAKG